MEAIGLIAVVVLGLFCLAGLILTPLGLPGNFVMIGGALVHNLIVWSMEISWMRLAVVFGLAIIGEILEWILSVTVTRKRGASGKAVIGAVIGGIIGAIIGTPVPIIGTIIGLCLGVFLGAFAMEYVEKKDFTLAYQSAIGAFYGRVGAILVKTMIGVLIVIVLFLGIF